jgi:hypothetical protein
MVLPTLGKNWDPVTKITRAKSVGVVTQVEERHYSPLQKNYLLCNKSVEI